MSNITPQPDDSTADQLCALYGWTPKALSEAVRTGAFPQADFVWDNEVYWRAATINAYWEARAEAERPQTLKHLEDLAPDLAAMRRLGEDDEPPA